MVEIEDTSHWGSLPQRPAHCDNCFIRALNLCWMLGSVSLQNLWKLGQMKHKHQRTANRNITNNQRILWERLRFGLQWTKQVGRMDLQPSWLWFLLRLKGRVQRESLHDLNFPCSQGRLSYCLAHTWGWGEGKEGYIWKMSEVKQQKWSQTSFFRSCHVACGILVPWPGIEPWPWQWKCRVLTTGPPGNSWSQTLNYTL